jgi:hypothetical protein
MTIQDVYKHFGSNWSEAARELKLGRNTSRYWLKVGYIPMPMQLRIENLTRGRLIADVNKINNNKE